MIAKTLKLKAFNIAFDSGSMPTDELISKELKRLEIKVMQKTLTLVSKDLSVSIDDIKGKSRKLKIARARQMYCFLVRSHYPEISLSKIGQSINRHHSTIIAGCNNARDLMKSNKSFNLKYQLLEPKMSSYKLRLMQ